jgi:hypothetical protein
MNLKVSVWDTYVKRDNGQLMHFDIIVPDDLTDEQIVFNYGKDYLKSKSIDSIELTSNECQFCHMEQAPETVIDEIEQKGYYILEMENCN